jgi:hypothetical protein
LKGKNITYGYSDFDTSNVISYLSKGDIKMLGCEYTPSSDSNYSITVHNWLTEREWYRESPAVLVIAGSNSSYNVNLILEVDQRNVKL